MSKIVGALEQIVDSKLNTLHTAFFAKVVTVSPEISVQPLHLIKQKGRPVQRQAIITGVPVLRHVGSIKAGDTVFCVCAEREIGQTQNGTYVLPVIGRHNIGDAVIVGVIG